MNTKWSISRRQGICAATERAFEDGERHVSLLDVVDGELQRLDLSMEAWREREAETERGSVEPPLYWWFTRHQVHVSKTVQLDLESLEGLFLQLEGRPETSVRELRYLLCLLLMRKRRVTIQRIERGAEGERMIVKRPRRDQRFEVFVYDFEPERMEALRAELQAVFDGAEGPEGVCLEATSEKEPEMEPEEEPVGVTEGQAAGNPEGADGPPDGAEGSEEAVPAD